jgi:hypothetical protein
MDDRVFWLQLMVWLMLCLDYAFGVWHRQLNAPKILGTIIAAGVLLSSYTLYSFYNPLPQRTSDVRYDVTR